MDEEQLTVLPTQPDLTATAFDINADGQTIQLTVHNEGGTDCDQCGRGILS